VDEKGVPLGITLVSAMGQFRSVADITYAHLARAFAYLAVILDAF
jgi:hypothetical protein